MDFLLSMKKRNSIFRFMAALITILTVRQIFENYKQDILMISFLMLILFLYTFNNIIRGKHYKTTRDRWYIVSYGISVVLLGILAFNLAFMGTAVFNILLLMELIIFNGKLNTMLIVFNFIIYAASYVCNMYLNFGTANQSDLMDILLNFLAPCLVLFLFRSVIAEKTKYESLTKELKDANTTLRDYAEKIEELTKTQERNRIAQELHDSMGHSLMALKMNLEYAENIIEVSPDKAKEVIHKTQNMTKDCVESLRKVVSLLKDTTSVEQLRVAIIELFHNFKETNQIKFQLEMDDSVELELPDIKNCIYKLIREAITNGMKHGNATHFYIDINRKFEMISLTIKNNGAKNNNIVKSNGILGMEERVKALGGNICFSSDSKYGFIIEVVIPKLEEKN